MQWIAAQWLVFPHQPTPRPFDVSTGEARCLNWDPRQTGLCPQLIRSIKANGSLNETLQQVCVSVLKPTENQYNYARWQRSKPISMFVGKFIAFRGILDRITGG